MIILKLCMMKFIDVIDLAISNPKYLLTRGGMAYFLYCCWYVTIKHIGG